MTNIQIYKILTKHNIEDLKIFHWMEIFESIDLIDTSGILCVYYDTRLKQWQGYTNYHSCLEDWVLNNE
jgi:hypothetical protein